LAFQQLLLNGRHNVTHIFRKFIIVVSLTGLPIVICRNFMGNNRKATISQLIIDIASEVKQKNVQTYYNTVDIICTAALT
jgi:hypothetical protein